MGIHFIELRFYSPSVVCYPKVRNLDIFPNHLMQQLKVLINWTIPFTHLKHKLIFTTHFSVVGTDMSKGQFAK